MAAPSGVWRSRSAAAARAAAGPAPAGPPAVAKRPETSRPAVKPAIEAAAGGQKQAIDERMLFVASALIGYTVQVQVKSGVVYEGIFHALRPAGQDFDVLLRMAKPLQAASASEAEWEPVRPTALLAIAAADLVQLTATDVRLGASDVGSGASAWDDAGGFGTDAAISRARGNWGRERELQRWAPDESDGGAFMHLEESVGPVGRGWDQFAVNEAKFGVRTDYAEELYTTELDPSKSKISFEEAARIAAEIERGDHSSVANIHMLEERGVAIDDSQMDEEDRYGAVVRDAPPPPPPAAAATNGAAAAAATAAATAPRPNAWAQGAPRPRVPTPTAPISIDARKEANKLRAQMTSGGLKPTTSPYGTPNKRASPLNSPLISDPSKFEALNLNPGVPRVDEQTRREFEQFKAQQAASKSGGADLFKKQDIQELKQFSQNIESKLSKSLSSESKMPAKLPSAAAAEAAAAAAAAAQGAPAAAALATEQPAAAAQQAAAEPAAAAGGAEQPAAVLAAPASEKKSGLNPFAKSFNFNPNAKEFKPTFTPSGTTAAAAPAAAPAALEAAAGAAPAAGAGPAAAGPAAIAPAPAGAQASSLGTSPATGAGGPKHMAASPAQPSPMQAGIPMPDMRPDFRRGPDGSGGPPPRDGSFGRRREESRERGGSGSYERRREGRHFDGPGGMRPGEGPPPPPPGKGPGGPQGMQMGMMPGPPHPMMMGGGPHQIPVMMGPGGQAVMMQPGMPAAYLVRPMAPGQPGIMPIMQPYPMGPGMVPPPGMPQGMVYAMPPPSMAGGGPGGRPVMMPQMVMVPPGAMMYPPGGPAAGGGGGGKGDDGPRGD